MPIGHGGNPVILRAIAVIGLSLWLPGCSPMSRARLGIRPDLPASAVSSDCASQFDDLVDYSQTLREAYRTRASGNRFWIYVAGTMALGTLAATGGLAAAGAATLSIALLSVSGGFTSGVFAVVNNSTLASVYTISENKVADSIVAAKKAYPASCENAKNDLLRDVTAAENQLDRARTDAALAAAIAAQAQLEKLRAFVKENPTNPPNPANPGVDPLP